MGELSEITIGQMTDLHLGYRQYGVFERVIDFYSAAAKAADILVEQKPDLVLIPGDIFHRSLPYPVEQRHAISLLNTFKEAGVPVVVIRGNHDASYAWTKRQGGNEMHVLEDLGLVTYLEDECREVELADGKRVRVWGLGYHGGDASAALAELVESNADSLADKSMPNILLIHEYLENVVPSARLSEYAIDVHGFDYVALGHYHGWWENGAGNMCCTGSTEHVSSSEWDEPERSVALVSLKKTRTGWKTSIVRHRFKVRPKVQKTLELGTVTMEEAKQAVSATLAEFDEADIVLRLDVKGTFSDTQVGFDLASLASNAKKAFHVKIVPEMDYAGLPVREDVSDKDVMKEVFVERLNVPKSQAARWVKLAEGLKDVLVGSVDTQAETTALELLYDFVKPGQKKGSKRRSKK